MKFSKSFLLLAFTFFFCCPTHAKTEYCSELYRQANVSAFKFRAFQAFDKDNLVAVCDAGLSGGKVPANILTSANGGKSWHMRWSAPDVYLSKIVFLDRETGFAAGAEFSNKRAMALILKTTDGGLTWQKTRIEVSEDIEDIHFINHMAGFAITDQGTLLTTVDAGRSWKITGRNQFGLKPVSPARINFSDKDSGWLIAPARLLKGDDEETFNGGEIYQTTDGGKTWTSRRDTFQNLLKKWQPTGMRFEEIKFFDSKTGCVAAHFERVGEKRADATRHLNYEGVAIFSTADGGANWTVNAVTGDFGLSRVSFNRKEKLWMIPSYIWQQESIFTSRDSGKSWTRISTKFTAGANPSEIFFVNAKVGFLIADLGTEDDDLYRTLDGGKTWNNR